MFGHVLAAVTTDSPTAAPKVLASVVESVDATLRAFAASGIRAMNSITREPPTMFSVSVDGSTPISAAVRLSNSSWRRRSDEKDSTVASIESWKSTVVSS